MSNIKPIKRYSFDLDQTDESLPIKQSFHIPLASSGDPAIYFCGHSLGLQPKSTQNEVLGVLNQWGNLGVRGHFEGDPWIHYQREIDQMMADLVGAKEDEVVTMSTLTVNIHLLLNTFYQPHGDRSKILMEAKAFPSDVYAVKSHLRSRGYQADQIVYWERNRESGHLELDDLETLLGSQGHLIATCLLGGVNFYSGQYLDIPAVTRLVQAHGIKAGFDLAHAAGNVPLDLHEWNVDFAAWCTYKYLHGGPGSPGAIFIHERHHDQDMPRFEGWWGNDLENRFEMLQDFTPAPGSKAWQISNPPVLALPALKASLRLITNVGKEVLVHKSRLLTGYLIELLDNIEGSHFDMITPRNALHRGTMVSIKFRKNSKPIFQSLSNRGVMADWRRPDVIRVSPIPLYCTFDDVYRFSKIMEESLIT